MVRSIGMRLAFIAATLGGASLLAAVACSSSKTGPEADAGPEAGEDAADAADAGPPLPYPLDQVCAPSTEPDVCGKCSREHCCDTRTRLLGTDAGNALVDCIQPASCNAACESTCFDSAPAETTPFLEHYSCMLHHCQIECGDGAPAGCTTCLEDRCARESLRCNLSRDCFVLGSCVAACGKVETCVDECHKRYPGGSAASLALGVCGSNLCPRECSP